MGIVVLFPHFYPRAVGLIRHAPVMRFMPLGIMVYAGGGGWRLSACFAAILWERIGDLTLFLKRSLVADKPRVPKLFIPPHPPLLLKNDYK